MTEVGRHCHSLAPQHSQAESHALYLGGLARPEPFKSVKTEDAHQGRLQHPASQTAGLIHTWAPTCTPTCMPLSCDSTHLTPERQDLCSYKASSGSGQAPRAHDPSGLPGVLEGGAWGTGGSGDRDGAYRSWRRKTLLRLSLTMSSSSVSCSLEMRGISSRTRCCMARHVRCSSYGTGSDTWVGNGPGLAWDGAVLQLGFHGKGLGLYHMNINFTSKHSTVI